MFIDIDYNKRKKGYKINLAKPNQQTIASISEAYGANYSIKLGNINEVTFNVPYFIDKLDERVRNENIELIKERMYTKISYNNNDEWMVIDTIEDVGSGDEKYMAVTAFTNVYETSNRKINELNLEVVNPEEYYDKILNDVAWSIGTIDPLFKDIYRSVELSNVTVLEAIITGAETFGAVLGFDTENKKINLIDIDSRAKYRGLNINYSNFLQSINRKRSVDEMTTRLYVYGSEDLSIENVNPTGMRYLEDFTYFLYPFERDESKNVIKSSHYMSDDLAHAILDKNELSEEYQPLIQAMQEEIDEETIEYINETTLLNELRFDEMSVSGLLDIAKATGDNDLILQRQGELAEIKTKISIKELTVDHISATIEDLERQISQLQSQISVTSFSKELYDELSMYIIESEFRDDRYIDEEELYRDALKKFEESKSPSVVIEASIDNIIDSLEEDYYSDKVVLGDIARVTDKEMSVEMKSLIVELSFDLDNNTCDVTIANGDIEKDGYDRILSVLYDTQSTTTMLENNKHKWDTVTDVKTEVDLMRDGEIDATRNRIKAGFRESVTIEDRGIILSNPDFPNEIVIMQAGVIALSTDGGENWSTSITPRGVMADTIIGKLVASNNLIVTNDSGSFRIDSDGLTVDMDSIKIMSGEGDTPENIVDSWNKMLITMDEFADDGKLNEYEKNQIARQWNSIAIAHSSMVDAIQNAYGPETPENPYPAEYEIYMESYEELRRYLNDEIQSDGHTILDPLHRSETTNIDSDKYNRLVSDYEVNKDRFQTVIPLEFSQTFMEQTRNEISLNYVKNGEVATKLNLSEEGVRIDGRLLEINSETHFNDDLVMNAGLIRSADGAINIDLNAGIINLSRPLTINAVPVATEEDLKGIGMADRTEILSGTEIYTDRADDSVVHVEIDGKSYQDGDPTPDYPIEIHSLNDFDVVSQKSEGGMIDDIEVGVTNEKNTTDSEGKIYPLQSLDDWSRYYKKSPAIVTNPNDTAYQKWGYSGEESLINVGQVRGGMFNNALPINGHLNGGIDTPATAWAGINISKMYLETNDATLLPRIKAIGDFFLNHVIDIDIWGEPLKAIPNTVTFDEVSRQWIPSTRFIHTRTFYHVAWALLEIYDVTKDTKYSNLAGQLLDGATMIQLMATGQANSNELPPYFSGAMFNTINNVSEASYEPDWSTFTNTNGDMVVRATNKWIKLFGNSARVSFDLYTWEEKNYTVKSIADDYISHLLYLYNNQGLRKPDGHNLLYNFSHFEWEDEPHPDGYMIPIPMNWDFIDEVFGKDQWFTGDLMFWAIIGFAEAGETQIANSLLDRYYELKAPDSEGRLLFYDRYTAQGAPLVHDTSKSIAFTGLYMQARNVLGNNDYDAECLSTLKYYQKESAFNTVDGGFSWDTEDYSSFIENKSLGEILFSIMENTPNRTPAPEDVTEGTNHPLIDKINLLLSEPLRSVGDLKDRLFRDTDGLWKVERNVGEYTTDGTDAWDMGVSSGGWKDNGDTRAFYASTLLSKMKPARTKNAMTDKFTVGNHTSSIVSSDNEQFSLGYASFGVVFRINKNRLSTENSAGFRGWLAENPVTIVYELAESTIETLDQELQDKLNNLRSFQGSNYVYTIINDKTDILSERLKPTLHATFKGGGWYERFKTEQELERHQRELDEKADTDLIDNIQDQLDEFVLVEGYEEEIGEINQALQDYKELIESGEVATEEAVSDITALLDRTVIIENNLGAFTESWNFEVTEITMGEEGLFLGDNLTDMGIRIAPQVGDTPPRIDFVDNGTVVAEITGQYMKINRGIFVQSATIGEHKIETIAGGHTIWQWIPSTP